MLVTGRFGLKCYSLADPAAPVLLDEVTAEDLRLPGDPPVDFCPDAAPRSTFWQNEDMDVDRERKLAILSRDPRAFAGSTSREPGEADPNGATNIAGVYVVDAKDPAKLRLSASSSSRPATRPPASTAASALWTGGPGEHTTQRDTLGWTFGRPIIATDLSNPTQAAAPSRWSRSTCSGATA